MTKQFYRAFEDLHRGSRDVIKLRLRAYEPFLLPLVAAMPAPAALDLGCGRGEWLELLAEHGFDARGVDLDEGMLAACRERGLKVQTQDALSGLRAQPDASLALVSAFHLIEHIPFEDVQELIAEALRVLQPGGLLILETPNPENLTVASSGFYMDPSHLRPIPPMLLEFVVGFEGFPRHKVVRLQEPAALHGPIVLEPINLLNGVSPDFSVVAQKAAPQSVLVPFDDAFATSFGIELSELSSRYQQQQVDARAAIQATVSRLEERVAAVETGTVNMFDRALGVVGETNSAMQALQMELTTSLQRERSAIDWSRGVEQRLHTLSAEAITVERQLQLATVDAGFLSQRLEQALAAQADAEARASRADDAMHLVQEAKHIQWQLDVAQARIAAAEHTVVLLYASTSWKLTAPVRFVSRVLRRLVRGVSPRGLGQRSMRALRPMAAASVRKIMRNGTLSRLGMGFLARHPGLKARLRRLVGSPHGQPAHSSYAAPTAATGVDGTPNLTPRAARLLADLQKAGADRKP